MKELKIIHLWKGVAKHFLKVDPNIYLERLKGFKEK